MKDKPMILVVDDDPSIATLVRLYLEKDGFAVETAARGDDALAAFRKNPPDLILLDIMLPGLDGTEVLKAVRRTSAIPVIMLTARPLTPRNWWHACAPCCGGPAARMRRTTPWPSQA